MDTLVAVTATAILCTLGLWQWHRADEKASIADAIERQQARPGITLAELLAEDEANWLYRKLRVTGRFSDKGMVFVDNQIRKGVAGFNVLMPLQLSDSSYSILVDRGWLAQQTNSREPPQVEAQTDEVSVEGILLKPSPRPFMPSSATPLDMQAGNLWLYLDLDKYVQEYTGKLLPVLLLQQNDLNDGLQREVFHFESKKGMHLGYAIQWFGLAIIVIVIWLVISFRMAPAKG